MPDETPSTTSTTEAPAAASQGPSDGHIARLRQAAREGAQARKETAALRREIAFVRAGVPEANDSKLAAMFRRTYEGDDEGVAAAWAEVAPAPPAAPVPVLDEYGVPIPPPGREVELAPGEVSSSDERHALASGAGYVHEPEPDPREIALAVGRRIVADGGTEGDALAAHFNVLAQAAQRGDKRVRL